MINSYQVDIEMDNSRVVRMSAASDGMLSGVLRGLADGLRDYSVGIKSVKIVGTPDPPQIDGAPRKQPLG